VDNNVEEYWANLGFDVSRINGVIHLKPLEQQPSEEADTQAGNVGAGLPSFSSQIDSLEEKLCGLHAKLDAHQGTSDGSIHVLSQRVSNLRSQTDVSKEALKELNEKLNVVSRTMEVNIETVQMGLVNELASTLPGSIEALSHERCSAKGDGCSVVRPLAAASSSPACLGAQANEFPAGFDEQANVCVPIPGDGHAQAQQQAELDEALSTKAGRFHDTKILATCWEHWKLWAGGYDLCTVCCIGDPIEVGVDCPYCRARATHRNSVPNEEEWEREKRKRRRDRKRRKKEARMARTGPLDL